MSEIQASSGSPPESLEEDPHTLEVATASEVQQPIPSLVANEEVSIAVPSTAEIMEQTGMEEEEEAQPAQGEVPALSVKPEDAPPVVAEEEEKSSSPTGVDTEAQVDETKATDRTRREERKSIRATYVYPVANSNGATPTSPTEHGAAEGQDESNPLPNASPVGVPAAGSQKDPVSHRPTLQLFTLNIDPFELRLPIVSDLPPEDLSSHYIQNRTTLFQRTWGRVAGALEDQTATFSDYVSAFNMQMSDEFTDSGVLQCFAVRASAEIDNPLLCHTSAGQQSHAVQPRLILSTANTTPGGKGVWRTLSEFYTLRRWLGLDCPYRVCPWLPSPKFANTVEGVALLKSFVWLLCQMYGKGGGGGSDSETDSDPLANTAFRLPLPYKLASPEEGRLVNPNNSAGASQPASAVTALTDFLVVPNPNFLSVDTITSQFGLQAATELFTRRWDRFPAAHEAELGLEDDIARLSRRTLLNTSASKPAGDEPLTPAGAAAASEAQAASANLPLGRAPPPQFSSATTSRGAASGKGNSSYFVYRSSVDSGAAEGITSSSSTKSIVAASKISKASKSAQESSAKWSGSQVEGSDAAKENEKSKGIKSRFGSGTLRGIMSQARKKLAAMTRFRIPVRELKPTKISPAMIETGALHRAFMSLDKVSICAAAELHAMDEFCRLHAREEAWGNATEAFIDVIEASEEEREAELGVGKALEANQIPFLWPWKRASAVKLLRDTPRAEHPAMTPRPLPPSLRLAMYLQRGSTVLQEMGRQSTSRTLDDEFCTSTYHLFSVALTERHSYIRTHLDFHEKHRIRGPPSTQTQKLGLDSMTLPELQDALMEIIAVGKGGPGTLDMLEALDAQVSYINDIADEANEHLARDLKALRETASTFYLQKALKEWIIAHRLSCQATQVLWSDIIKSLDMDLFLEEEELPFLNEDGGCAVSFLNPPLERKKPTSAPSRYVDATQVSAVEEEIDETAQFPAFGASAMIAAGEDPFSWKREIGGESREGQQHSQTSHEGGQGISKVLHSVFHKPTTRKGKHPVNDELLERRGRVDDESTAWWDVSNPFEMEEMQPVLPPLQPPTNSSSSNGGYYDDGIPSFRDAEREINAREAAMAIESHKQIMTSAELSPLVAVVESQFRPTRSDGSERDDQTSQESSQTGSRTLRANAEDPFAEQTSSFRQNHSLTSPAGPQNSSNQSRKLPAATGSGSPVLDNDARMTNYLMSGKGGSGKVNSSRLNFDASSEDDDGDNAAFQRGAQRSRK